MTPGSCSARCDELRRSIAQATLVCRDIVVTAQRSRSAVKSCIVRYRIFGFCWVVRLTLSSDLSAGFNRINRATAKPTSGGHAR